MPQWGLGLTDIAEQVSGMDRELPPGALGRQACAELKAKIEAVEPRWLAFTSLTAGRRYLGRAAGFGEQPDRIGQTRVWLLPSPSPTAGWNWDRHKHSWRTLADAAREDQLAASHGLQPAHIVMPAGPACVPKSP